MDEKHNELIYMLQIVNTSLKQLIDINMLLLQSQDELAADTVNIVHNKLNMFMTDDTWQQLIQKYENDTN